MTEPREITINVPVLARVEGEGALELAVKDGVISDLKLKIYEPPRLISWRGFAVSVRWRIR
jgi:sulfhydrogenase subunit alpha